MTTRARDFKFAGAIVQRLYLVMVALTKNRLSVQYGWFFHGRSHILYMYMYVCIVHLCLVSPQTIKSGTRMFKVTVPVLIKAPLYN